MTGQLKYDYVIADNAEEPHAAVYLVDEDELFPKVAVFYIGLCPNAGKLAMELAEKLNED